MFNNYNPYYQPINRYQPMQPTMPMPEQPVQNIPTINTNSRSMLNGKQVDSIDVVKAMDIPLDGSISYFPLVDGSAIVTKQLKNDGTSKTTIYKPVEEKEIPKIEYATMEDLKKSIKEIDLSEIDDIKEDIKEIKTEIKKIKKGD